MKKVEYDWSMPKFSRVSHIYGYLFFSLYAYVVNDIYGSFTRKETDGEITVTSILK